MEQKPNQEKLKIEVRMAGPDDWQTYKDLRLEAINSKDSEMFGFTPGDLSDNKRKAVEASKTEKDWREDLAKSNFFVFLVFQGSIAIGMGIAKYRGEQGDWYMASGYIKEGFRNKGIGKKLFATRLSKIKEMHGKKVTLAVKAINTRSIHVAEYFGFKKIAEDTSNTGFYMQLNNIYDPEVVSRINDALNAR